MCFAYSHLLSCFVPITSIPKFAPVTVYFVVLNVMHRLTFTYLLLYFDSDCLNFMFTVWPKTHKRLKRTLFNGTKDKMCKFSRKSSFLSYIQHKNKQFT